MPGGSDIDMENPDCAARCKASVRCGCAFPPSVQPRRAADQNKARSVEGRRTLRATQAGGGLAPGGSNKRHTDSATPPPRYGHLAPRLARRPSFRRGEIREPWSSTRPPQSTIAAEASRRKETR